MKRCPECGYTRAYQLGDGRRKCRRCGHRYRWRSAWDASRLSVRVKHELLQRFVWGVPVYRQRFGRTASRPAIERFYRLIRACMAQQEQLREPFAGALECDETTFGGARHGKRGWGAAGKVVVFGIVKRNGEVKAAPIAQHDQAAIMEQIQATPERARCTTPMRGRPMPPCGYEVTMWWCARRKAGPSAGTISTALRASGATPRIGSILTVECLANTSTFTWGKFAGALTTEIKT